MIPKIVRRWMAENPVHTAEPPQASPIGYVQRGRCAMCGAVEGIPHHDPLTGGFLVKLRKSRLRAQWECQRCNAGMAEVRRAERKAVTK